MHGQLIPVPVDRRGTYRSNDLVTWLPRGLALVHAHAGGNSPLTISRLGKERAQIDVQCYKPMYGEVDSNLSENI